MSSRRMQAWEGLNAKAGWISIILTTLLLIVLLTPFAAPMPNASLDGSWAFAMNIATSEHLRFGKDIIFTFGPFASIYTNVYHPETDLMMLAGSLLLAVSLAVGLAAAVPPERRSFLLIFPLVVALIWLPYGSGWRDATLMLVPLLLPLVIARGTENGRVFLPAVFLLAASISILPLVKASFTLTVAVSSLVAVTLSWRSSPKLAIAVPAFQLLFMVVTWCVIGQDIADLPGYFISQAPIVSGYTDAMSTTGDSGPYLLVVYIVAAAVLVVMSLKGGILRNWHLSLLISLYLFVAFKSGFVRADSAHAQGASTALLLMGVLLFLLQGREHRRGVASLSVGVAGACLIAFSNVSPDPAAALERVANAIRTPTQALWVRLSEPNAFFAAYHERISKLQDQSPFMGEEGEADLYPHELGMLLVSKVKWKPRPILQSYSAYTPALLQKNAAHLQKNPPARIFFKIDPIDGRYPALDDGVSWLELLGSYSPQKVIGGYVALERRQEVSAGLVPTALVPTSASFGEVVPVPSQEGPVWVSIDIKQTVLGKAVSALYKAPRLVLDVAFADGTVSSHRIVAGAASTGFLLSPSLSDATGFVALGSSYQDELLGARKVVSIVLRGERGSRWMWRSVYGLNFSRLSIPASSNSDVVLTGAWSEGMSAERYPEGGNCNIEEVAGTAVGMQALELPPKLVKVRGWAALDAHGGVPNDGVSLLAEFGDGSARIIPATRVPRLDVAKHFDQPGLANVGYEAYVDVRKLAGLVHFRVLQLDAGQWRVCRPPLLSIRRVDPD